MFVLRALSAVDYPKASSSALACDKWLHGAVVGAGESSGIDRLRDVPGFRGVWHRRKSFAQVPRSRILRSSLPASNTRATVKTLLWSENT